MSNSSGEILRRQQLHLMSECGNVTRPVMRSPRVRETTPECSLTMQTMPRTCVQIIFGYLPTPQFELELKSLNQLENFRSQVISSKGATAKWMHPTATLCWAGISRYVLGTPELSLIRRPRR